MTRQAPAGDIRDRPVVAVYIGNQIVRDERQGGYQTQAVPVQGFGRMTEEVAP